MEQQAFILRIAPGDVNRVQEALDSNQLFIGWPEAEGLLDENLSWTEFRDIVKNAYYRDQENLRSAGAAAGNLWRFIRDMKIGDLVVVPHHSHFYVAEIAGPATYRTDKIAEETAYRRSVVWLNGKSPVPRTLAKSAFISRMKAQGTCTVASDLLEDIKECLELSASGENPSFNSDLQKRLIKETLSELRNGRMESFAFERLIQTVLLDLGAKESKIVPRSLDKGADILATFYVAGAFQQVVAVQAKHWQPEPPVGASVVRQLISGIEAEGANMGMVVTSGAINEGAREEAKRYYEDKGIKIELLDGEDFAKLIVENGIQQV